MVYSTDLEVPGEVAPHYESTYAQNWFLLNVILLVHLLCLIAIPRITVQCRVCLLCTQAVRSSPYYVEEINNADIVFVDDYCHYHHWLGHLHQHDRRYDNTPGDALEAAYNELIGLPRWQRAGGTDFVFFDSHPGFRCGKAAPLVDLKLCSTFSESIQIIMDAAMRQRCGKELDLRRTILAPFVSNLREPTQPESELREPFHGLGFRDLFLYFNGNCNPMDEGNKGKAMRRAVIAGISALDTHGIRVTCTNKEHGGQEVKYVQSYQDMQRAKFCLILPGDSPSTRRLGESMLAGCVPVFVGPPYHSMPMSGFVPYDDLAIVYNISQYSSWLDKPFQWKAGGLQPDGQAEWWLPDDQGVLRTIITVRDVKEVSRCTCWLSCVAKPQHSP